MLKKTITYTDYNGIERTEDFYFNISKSELTKLEVTTPGGYSGMIKKIVDAQDGGQIMKVFNELITMSYGVKSDDGKRFKKSQELSDEFVQTEAYDQLFMELATDAEKAAAFVSGVLPSDLTSGLPEDIAKDTIAKYEKPAEKKSIASSDLLN